MKTTFHIVAVMLSFLRKAGKLWSYVKDALLLLGFRASSLGSWLTPQIEAVSQPNPTILTSKRALTREDKMCLAALHLIGSLHPHATLPTFLNNYLTG